MLRGFTITQKGLALLAKLHSGSTLEITRVMIGDGQMQDNENPLDLEDLVAPIAQATSTKPVSVAQVTVVNNRAPDAPTSITVPMAVNGGASLVITWGAATDSDGNLAGYELERQVNGGNWTQIFNLTFMDSITKGWNTVAYRVRAYDDL